MPEMDGYEFVRAVRRHTTRYVPTIAVSGSVLDADVQRARDAGFDGYVVKPMSLGSLLQVVRDVIVE